jgi:purine-cytosine permease-like protein
VLALAVDGSAYEPFLFLIGAVFVPLAATVVVDFWLSRDSYDTSEAAPARWLMLLPWLAGFVAYQLTAPTVLSAWPGWEAFWRHGQDLLHISPTNGFSASIVSLAVAAVLTPLARLAGSRQRLRSVA